MKRICVIGAGVSGLPAIKQCIDQSLDVICYEKTEEIGGLWRYREHDISENTSVNKCTLSLTSKETAAYSDFPPPDHFPNIMSHEGMYGYLSLYADHFNLRSKIRFNCEVCEVKFADCYEKTGKWKVTVKDKNNNTTIVEIFDGVMVAIGKLSRTLIPNIPGKHLYKGQILHSREYRIPDGFKDKIVVVVGTGNSGIDIAADLAAATKQVYLSVRSGCFVVPRISTMGFPFDTFLFTRYLQYLSKILPYSILLLPVQLYLKYYFDHSLPELVQNPAEATFVLHDDILNSICTKEVIVRKQIERFTENGVIFEGMETETKCDAVIFATGYEVYTPFLTIEDISEKAKEFKLYKKMFYPNLQHPETLAFIGLIFPLGPAFGTMEMQARYFVQLMLGNVKLPSREKMLKSIENDIKNVVLNDRSFQYALIYMDELAANFGAKPPIWKYFFNDFQLWKKLFFGPGLSYQYRLVGPNSWPGARDAIFKFEERVKAGFEVVQNKKVLENGVNHDKND